MKIAVVGSINMDMTVKADRIPLKGETIMGQTLSLISGGKGANQAFAMARLGGDVTMYGCVGDDENGRRLIDNMKSVGIHTEKIAVKKGVPTGVALITVAENDNAIVVVPGANAEAGGAYLESIKEDLLTYDMVVFQHEIPVEDVWKTCLFLGERKVPVILNPAPAAAVPLDVIEKVRYITPNEHEARLIFEESDLETLVKRYPDKLIITRGSQGVIAADAMGNVVRVPVRAANVLDTTGAGDTLNGAFALRRAEGADLEKALAFANVAASLSTEKFGAQSGMPDRTETEKELKSYEEKRHLK